MNFKSILQTFVKIFLPLAFGCLLLWFLYSHMDVTEIWRVIREGVRYHIGFFTVRPVCQCGSRIALGVVDFLIGRAL